MHLAILAGIITTFVAATMAAAQPVSDPVAKTTGIVALALAQVFVARAVSDYAFHSMKSPSRGDLTHLFRIRRLHIYLWLACSGSIVLVLQWPQIVQRNLGLGGMILVDEIITLLPIIAPLLFSWAEFDRMDRATSNSTEGEWKADRTPGWLSRTQQYLVIPLAPLLLLTSARDALRWSMPNWGVEHSSAIAAAFTLVVVAVALPFVIRFCWPTAPLERSSLRRRLETSAMDARVRLLNVLIWSPGPNVLNAATTGYLPRLRYVLLSKGLIDELSEIELEAVFAHELAHIRRGHLYRLLIALSIPVLVGLATINNQPSSLAVGLTTAFASFAYLVIFLGRYAKLLEHDADLWACQHLAKRGDATDERTSQERTTRHYILALSKTAAEEERKSDDWLHPSLNDRFEFLQRVVSNESVAHQFTRRLQRINLLFMVLALSLLTIGICGS